MGPNLTNINKVLDRIQEIARKYAPFDPQVEKPRIETQANRFVELFDSQNSQNKKTASASKGKTTGQLSVDELRARISNFADKYNIDEELVRAVIQVESGWNAKAVSSKGARGLMQLMPRTAEMLGVQDSFDPKQNIEGGIKYLAQLTDKYAGDVEKALAAYNAGPSRVDAAGGAPFPETARYVKNVMALYHRYREED